MLPCPHRTRGCSSQAGTLFHLLLAQGWLGTEVTVLDGEGAGERIVVGVLPTKTVGEGVWVGVREPDATLVAAVGIVVAGRLLLDVGVGTRLVGGMGTSVSVGDGSNTTSRTGDARGGGVADGGLTVTVEDRIGVALATSGLSGVRVESEIATFEGRNLEPATRLVNPMQ